MDILFLSSLCSIREYKRMFQIYGTTSSHASQKFNRLFVTGLVENGCHVETLTQRIILQGGENDLHCNSECENGINFTYIPRKADKIHNRISTVKYAYDFILKWTKEHPDGILFCDIILGELSIAVFLASKIRHFNKIAIVTDVPSIRAGDGRKGVRSVPVKIKNCLIGNYDGFVFLTEQMNLELNKKNKPYGVVEGFADNKITDIPNTLQDKYSEKVIIMAGLLEDIYGVETLLYAFEQIEDKDARLRFYGRGGSVSKIETAAKKDSRITYCGEVTNDQIVAEEKKATLLINPRPALGKWTAYSFPSKNMEYMASGTPLVAYALPCMPNEYLHHFFVIEENSVECMKATLLDLLSRDRGQLHNFGLEAQRWISDEKCPQRQINKVISVITKITEKKQTNKEAR